MFKKLIFLVVLVMVSFPVFAQVDTVWVRTYNGPANSEDLAWEIAVDDSGYAHVTGYSQGTLSDVATIKYKPDGDTAWVRRYVGPLGEVSFAVALDDSHNVYVGGGSYGGGYWNYLTIKYGSEGNQIWAKLYDGAGSYPSDVVYDVAVDDSGNVYVTGYSGGSGTGQDYATIKYYPNGDMAWLRRYNGPGNGDDLAYAIAVDDSGNVYVTGYSGGSGTGQDYATIKYYPNGDTAWVRRYNGPGNYNDRAYDMTLDVSGNICITGWSSGGSYYGSAQYGDHATIKYYPNGDTVWVRRDNGPLLDYEWKNSMTVDNYDNVYVAGKSWNGSNYDYVTIKYYPNGDTAWVRRYNGTGNADDIAHNIVVDNYSNVYVTGESQGVGTNLDFATLRYSSDGNIVWVVRYNSPGNLADVARSIDLDNFGYVYITGVSGSGGSADYTTIKYLQNFAPSHFSLLSPQDSAVIPYDVTFNWETAIDPDSLDEAKYDLHISTSSGFHADSTVVHDSLVTTEYTDILSWGRYYWKVCAYDRYSKVWSNETWTFISALYGDANGDKVVSVSDAIYLINFLFKSGPAPNPLESGDTNCDSYATVSDIVYLINYLFKGGSPPGC